VHQKGHACPLVVKICVQVHLRLTKVEIITIGKMLICILVWLFNKNGGESNTQLDQT
jgi:hypothetical protein